MMTLNELQTVGVDRRSWKRLFSNFTAWLRKHDPNYAAIRRAGRTAIIMPGLFALCVNVISNVQMATFAAFGSIALLMLVDFSGPMRGRLQAQVALSVTGGIFVCLGTLTSQTVWLSVLSMGVVALIVIFAGVVSSVLASATTSLLLVFILSTAVPGPDSVIPDRLAGWGLASGIAFLAVWLLWPTKGQSALRNGASRACRALAARLRADASNWSGAPEISSSEREEIVQSADVAVNGLQRSFLSAPWRPTGLSTSSRAVVRLVDELLWLDTQIVEVVRPSVPTTVSQLSCAIQSSSAAVLETGADLLDQPFSSPAHLDGALQSLHDVLENLESDTTLHLPIAQRTDVNESELAANCQAERTLGSRIEEFVDSLETGFRAQELGYATSLVGSNINLAAAADRRGWLDTVAGRQPGNSSGRIDSARERAAAHFERHSVWLHNSVRGSIGLAIAVLVAEKTGLQHSFWVILGALSVLRSNAANTGQNALRALLGTAVGFVVGAGLLVLIGTNVTLLWFLLPLAILVAGFAPTAISFAAGQAGFTLTLVILFNLLQPTGWRVGLYRFEDVAIGGAVSVGVGLLFWPRGAAAALGSALKQAYLECGSYLQAAVNFGTERCDSCLPLSRSVDRERTAAAAASRRLDDAFRTYLAERSSKPVALAEVTALVTGVANLRQTADAVVSLWESEYRRPDGDRSAARDLLSYEVAILKRWYEGLGAGLLGEGPVPDALLSSATADDIFIGALSDDLRGADGHAVATAARLIWTRDYLESARRFEQTLVKPAEVVASKG